MYQFVLSRGEVPPFTLCTTHPFNSVPLSMVPVGSFENILVIVKPAEEDVSSSYLDRLADSQPDSHEVMGYQYKLIANN